MRNVFYFWICIAMWLLSACSSQKKEDRGDIQVLMKDSVDANGLQRMQVSDSKTSFTYKGKEYQSSVVRRPDDSLPVVINEQGDKFVDNSITLRITSGGKSIVDKVFTKESFASLVDAKFMKHSILRDWCMIRPHLRGSFMRQVCAIRSPTFTFHYRLLYLPMAKYPWRKKNCWKICTKQTVFDQRFQIVS